MESVASPCIGVCVLDADQYCLGCGRSLNDIASWGTATPAQQREMLQRALRRQAVTEKQEKKGNSP